MRFRKTALMTKHYPNFLIYLMLLHYSKIPVILYSLTKAFLFFSMLVNLGQYRGKVGMFINFFAYRRCMRHRICYRRKMQSCEFGLIITLFILLQAFSILIEFFKKIAWQNMLMVQINKKYLIRCFYLFLSSCHSLLMS